MRINDVLSQLKVGDVEYRKLGDIITFLNGRAYKQTELLSSGKYKVVRVGNFFTNDKWYYSDLELEENKYCYNGDLLYCWAASLGPQIWTGDKTIFHYHIWKLKFDETIISKRYLYHFLKKDVDDIYNSLTQSTMPHVSMASMKERIIPVPPLEVQLEIVKILDNFTELTSELTSELTARKKQYEYYRDLLLDFGVHGGGGQVNANGERLERYLTFVMATHRPNQMQTIGKMELFRGFVWTILEKMVEYYHQLCKKLLCKR